MTIFRLSLFRKREEKVEVCARTKINCLFCVRRDLNKFRQWKAIIDKKFGEKTNKGNFRIRRYRSENFTLTLPNISRKSVDNADLMDLNLL